MGRELQAHGHSARSRCGRAHSRVRVGTLESPGGGASWSCTKAVGVDGEMCKHVIAITLAATGVDGAASELVDTDPARRPSSGPGQRNGRVGAASEVMALGAHHPHLAPVTFIYDSRQRWIPSPTTARPFRALALTSRRSTRLRRHKSGVSAAPSAWLVRGRGGVGAAMYAESVIRLLNLDQ